jgi:recombinational DNA repair protein RecT
MNKEQITKAWEMGATKGKSQAHLNFPDEMSKKTAINRTCKLLWNSSDDSILLDSIKRTMDIDDLSDTTYEEVIETEVEEKANKIMLDVEVPADEKKEAEPQPAKSNGIDWENKIEVIAAIEQFEAKDKTGFNEFKRKNKQRLEMLRGDKNVMEALDKKENEVLRGF